MSSIVFDKALEVGLRPEQDGVRNEQSLMRCTNLCATERRLRPFTPITEPFSDVDYMTWGVGKGWPFPQLIRTNSKTLLMGKTAMWEVDEGDDWSATPVAIRMMWPQGLADYDTIPAGGTWHVADFYDRVYLFNGKCMLLEDYSVTDPTIFSWMVQKEVTINTGCAHREGRMFYGGFDPNNYYKTGEWSIFLNALLAKEHLSYFKGFGDGSHLNMGTNGPGPNWVWWSTIGGGDVTWLFNDIIKTLGTSGGLFNAEHDRFGKHERDMPFWQRMVERNEAGLRPMPFRGLVQKMIPIRGNVVVYGEDGVAALLSANAPDNTYGLYTFPDLGTRIGVAGRDAAAGGDGGQFFIDEEGESWFINPEMGIERLGHKEYFAPMLDGDIVVSHDERNNEFWIAGNGECYVRTKTGLSKAPWRPTTISFAGVNVGVRFGGANLPVEVVTHPFDGGGREITEVYEVRLTTTDTHTTGWKVAVDWRLRKDAAWARSDAVVCDKRGVVKPRVTGMEFRIVLIHDDRTKTDLERIEVELRDGRKSIRRIVDA